MTPGRIVAAFTSTLLALLPASANAGDLAPLQTERPIRATLEAGSFTSGGLGFAPSKNLPRILDRDAPAGRLSLIALPDEQMPYGKHRGFTVLLVNTTAEEVRFEAVDSRLRIVREAIDAAGRWRPIEFEPRSWCGNSYHTVFLPAGHYWTFTTPVYSGTFATIMRFALTLENGEKLYSNAFMGFIQPGQFELPPLR